MVVTKGHIYIYIQLLNLQVKSAAFNTTFVTTRHYKVNEKQANIGET